jgi:hypothetical protein
MAVFGEALVGLGDDAAGHAQFGGQNASGGQSAADG